MLSYLQKKANMEDELDPSMDLGLNRSFNSSENCYRSDHYDVGAPFETGQVGARVLDNLQSPCHKGL